MIILKRPEVGYPVYIGDESVVDVLKPMLCDRQVLVVTDRNVAQYHLTSVEKWFSDIKIKSFIIEPGEEQKSFRGFESVLDSLIDGAYHRDALVVAFGGGVVGDLSGFAASCYQRGIGWMVFPTSLLAQVDASIGGKTAINHKRGKNLIGAFHDPEAVWMNPHWLSTLPDREFRSGLAEVVKYGLGFDSELFEWLEQNVEALVDSKSPELLEYMLSRCADIKLTVVAQDRTEQGSRALLNLGHTLGHALERCLRYGAWLHGEAVAVGLVAAARLSVWRGKITNGDFERLVALLGHCGLPTQIPSEVSTDCLTQAILLDKKILKNRLRFIGLISIGRAGIWGDVSENELSRLLSRGRSFDL